MGRKRVGYGVGVLWLAVLSCGSWAWGQATGGKGAPSPELVLPTNPAVQFRYDGTDAHAAAWKKTAAHKAIVDSELFESVKKFAVGFAGNAPMAPQVERLVDHVLAKGLLIGATIKPGKGDDPDIAVATVLIDGAALQKDVETLLRQGGATIGAPAKKGAFTLASLALGPGSDSASLNLVTFGPHLAITSGSDDFLTRTANTLPARLTNSIKANSATGESIAVTWLDAKQLIASFGAIELPMPPVAANSAPLPISEILKTLGVDSLQQLVAHSGFKGSACWNSTRLEATAPLTGVMTLWSGPTFQLKDLPPLPESTPSFYAGSINWTAVYDAYWNIANTMAERVGPAGAVQQLEDGYGRFQDDLGFNIREDLITALGPKHVLYADSTNAFAGLGAGLCVEVKDAAKVQRVIEAILAKIPAGRGGPQVVRSKKYGRDLISVGMQGMPMWPTLCIDKEWLIVALTPQMVESFLLRRDHKLDSWSATGAVEDALKEFPKEWLSLTVSDPRPLLVGLGQYAPMLNSMVPPGVPQLELPPSDLMTKPLFPNVSICTVKDGVIHWQSRDSMPSLPGVGSLSGPSVGSSAVLVALLLPAVQQAREAARRSQSRNNLKQIALALHNYHDVFNQFPAGTIVESAKEPEDRLSWNVRILPYLDQAPLYNAIDQKLAWEKQPQELIRVQIPTLNNPSQSLPMGFADGGHTDYAGVAGLGAEGPKTKPGDKGAGLFAYDHPRGIRDITDGTSNTLMVGDVSGDRGSWARGGKSTIRPLTVKPYIKGPDGFGGAHVGGAHFVLADGSVRFISENIDAQVMEALTTIQGGEVLGDF